MYPNDVKGLFRRATVYEKQVLEQLAKEDKREFWDPDRVRKLVEAAKADLASAVKVEEGSGRVPDAAILSLQARLDKLEVRWAWLLTHYTRSV
jgi:hypothetical protein